MKIWDCFLMGGSEAELDVLECRLRELENTPVWRHVIVEAPETFTGKPKPMYYAEHRERFAPWADRITYVEGKLTALAPWAREAQQREFFRDGLTDAGYDDVVMMGDLDEIPEPQYITPSLGEGIVMVMRTAIFCVDWLHPAVTWRATVCTRAGYINQFQALRGAAQAGGRWLTPVQCGIHMSWLGGHQAMRVKAQAFSHEEARDMILAGIDAGEFIEKGLFWGWVQHPEQLIAAEVNETWPKWVHERKCPEIWWRPRAEQ